MTDPELFVASPSPATVATRSVTPRLGREVRSGVLIVATLAAVVIGAWVLYNRPAHTFSVNAHSATWAADVKLAIAEKTAVGPFAPTGALLDLPGVGRIASVLVDESATGNDVAVLFLTSARGNSGGLVYLHGYPPPQDTCNVHLGGPWWQLAPMNYDTMSCARGFQFTPGG